MGGNEGLRLIAVTVILLSCLLSSVDSARNSASFVEGDFEVSQKVMPCHALCLIACSWAVSWFFQCLYFSCLLILSFFFSLILSHTFHFLFCKTWNRLKSWISFSPCFEVENVLVPQKIMISFSQPHKSNSFYFFFFRNMQSVSQRDQAQPWAEQVEGRKLQRVEFL